MCGGLIDGWEDFVEKFKIRFAPLHALDHISFEKTSEKARDTFVHMMEDVTTLPTATKEDIDESKESSARSHIKEDEYSGSEVVGNDGGVINEDGGANINSDTPSHESNSTPRKLHVPLNALIEVEMTTYDVLESVNKVDGENCNQAAHFISLDTIKLFDLVKSEHQEEEEFCQKLEKELVINHGVDTNILGL
ncbi:unnamed protein product [Cuscuta campestris]|uniref:Uncharacterized protein n=1 Tax=Cuscuta campestris TaxID=132261 RepID=A0A484LBK0_9ASTE|nr:unnamed protein product [Cuscuta campestris]